jgi:hypothetical protein
MLFMIKLLRASLTLAVAMALAWPGTVAAAEFRAMRGLNLDIWVTWPAEGQWREAEMLLPFPEWRKHLTHDELAALMDDGFDFVRMPVDPAPFLSPVAAPLRKDLLMGVAEAVRLIGEAGLKVIVDIHLIHRADNPAIGAEGVFGNPATFAAYLGLVRELAGALRREDPGRVALELMNEPPADCTGAGQTSWVEQLRQLHAAARASATRLTLVLSGACGGNAEGLVALDPAIIPDDNVLWSFHSYQPVLITHQGAEWAGDFLRYVSGLDYPLHLMEPARREAAVAEIRARIREQAPLARRQGMLAYLDEQIAEIDTAEKLAAKLSEPFAKVAAWAGRHGIDPDRILLGEFGMIRQEYGKDHVVPGAARAAYAGDMIELAERNGFAWAIWGHGGAFGIVEAFDRRPAEPDVLDVVRSLPPHRRAGDG